MAGGLEDLDTVEPLARRVERHAFDRLIMLADGVFAIGVTLSALEIRPPADWDGSLGDFVRRMAAPLGVYAISFAVVGLFWMSNRRAMSRVARVDGPFSALTLAFLALIALVPAGDRFLVQAHGGQTHPAFVVYLGLISLISLVHAAMWAYAAFGAHLLVPGVTTRVKFVTLALTAVTPPVTYSLGTGAAVVGDGGLRLVLLTALAAFIVGRRVLLRWAER